VVPLSRLRILWPPREMMIFCAVGLLLLGCGNVGLVYAEKTMPSGLSSLVLAVIPLIVALIEMLLPEESRCRRAAGSGWGLDLRTGSAGVAVDQGWSYW